MKTMKLKNQLVEIKNIKITVGFATVGKKFNLNGNLTKAMKLQIKIKFLFILVQKILKLQKWITINKETLFTLNECVLEKEYFIFLL